MKRALRFGFLGFIVAGCAVHVGTQPSVPGQQPIPPPQAYNQHPGYVYYPPGQAAPPPQRPAVAMPPALSIKDFVNVAHFQQVAASPAKGCSIPLEVSPGNFVHLDCFPYKRISIAQVHATPAKLKMMSTGQIAWNPLSLLQGAGLALPNMPTGAAAAPVKAGTYPDMVDHRLNGTEGPIKDQGDVGSCTAFALSSVMDNSFRRGSQNITTSPEHIWSHYATPTMEDAASGNLNKGITTFDALPYSGKEACELMKDSSDDCGSAYNVRPNTAASDSALQGKLRTADAANGHRAVNFEELSVSPPNIDEIVSVLASGADLWTAFNIDSSKFVNKVMSNFTIPDWVIPDGGHALAMVGYRKVNGSYQFLIHNSWGVSWGDQGYAWISQNMVQQWMHLAYKVRTDLDPGGVTPALPKTDEDCGGAQVIDTVTHTCATVCTDGSHPANGQCQAGGQPAPAPLTLPGLPGFSIPGIPAIPGWNPGPAPAQPAAPAQPGQPAAPAPAGTIQWPWPVPTNLPPFLTPPK